MKATFVSAISSGEFDLTQMLERIDYYHAIGKLTTEEREELAALARERARDAMGVDVKAEILALWEAVNALRAQLSANGSEPETAADEYPEFVAPTGAHDAYNIGDQITYQGTRYRSTINANVWPPDVYPAGWEEVEV